MTRDSLNQKQPKLFKEFQEIIKSDRLGHAYLFIGQFGSLEMAILLTQSRYCENLSEEGLPCQECRSCRLIASDEFSDVKRLKPTNQIIKTDLVREVMQNFAQSGFETDHQVLIIEGADKLHPNAANSLLKFIEEPQSKVNIFLLTDQEASVLPTIKSRCQIFTFPKNKTWLQDTLEQEGLLKSQAQLLAELCSTVEEALALSKSSNFIEQQAVAEQWVKAYLAGDQMAYLLSAKLAGLLGDKAEQGRVLDLLTLLLAKALPAIKAQQGLSKLIDVRAKWQANVNFQSALEYMILLAIN